MSILKQSSTEQPLTFLLVSSSDHITGVTGLTPTVKISKSGATGISPSGAISQVDATNHPGLYQVAANATDTNTLGPLWLHAIGTGTDPVDVCFDIVAFDPQDSVRIGLTSLPNATAGATGGIPSAQNSNGAVRVDYFLGTALTESIAGQLSGGFKKFFDVTSPAVTLNQVSTFATNGSVNVAQWNSQAVTVDSNNTPNVSTKYVGGALQTAGDIMAAVSNIAVTGAALNTTAASATYTTGSDVGGYTNTFAADGTYDAVTSAAGTLDFYYQFSLGSTGQTAVTVGWLGYVVGIVNTVKVYAYNWGNSAFEQIGTVVGISGTVNMSVEFDLTSAHTGTGVNLGLVRLRFAATGLTAAVVNTDRILCGYTVVTVFPTGFASLTTSAIATSVWTDTTAGDFTTSGSIGKSLFTGGVVPGGTNGLFIAGTNAATAITTSLTTHLIGTVDTVTTVTNQLSAAAIATGVWTDTVAGDFTTTSSPGKILQAQLGGTFTTTSSSIFSVASLANAPTGGSAPTVSQIATAVWQDVTAGDFTVASSIGKSLYTGGVSPGVANGLFIAGTNAATTITTSLTTHFIGTIDTCTTLTNTANANLTQIDGTTTASGNAHLTLKSLNLVNPSGTALLVSSTTSTAAQFTAGGSGFGLELDGAGTGAGLYITGNGTNTNAVTLVPTGSGQGISGIATLNSVTNLQTHGDSTWATATGFALASSWSSTLATSLSDSFASSGVFSIAALANAPSGGGGGGGPTAAQIATAVWQDASSGDFSIVGSPGHILVTQLGGTFTSTLSSVFNAPALANSPTGGGSGGDPWATVLTNSYAPNTAGYDLKRLFAFSFGKRVVTRSDMRIYDTDGTTLLNILPGSPIGGKFTTIGPAQ